MRLERPEWTSPSAETTVPHAPVEVWRLELGEMGTSPLNQVSTLTVAGEHERAAKFRQEADRLRHLAGRALLRAVLSERYACDPRSISVTEDARGKPHVEEPMGGDARPRVNVAHAADVVVAAISEEQLVGIDVEPIDRMVDTEMLVDRVLTPAEMECWRTQPAETRDSFFLHMWTCKEACLKAKGQGLRQGAQCVECVVSDGTVTGVRVSQPERPDGPEPTVRNWDLRTFWASEGVAGAVVREKSIPGSLYFGNGAPLLRRLASAA